MTGRPATRHAAQRVLLARADRWRAVAQAVLLGLAYFALAWASVQATPYAGGVAYVWPAGGVALATLLLAPRRHWPHILCAVFAANALYASTDGHAAAVAVAFAVPNVLMPGASAWLLLRLSGRPARLASVRAVLVFMLVAPIGVNAITAVLGAAVPHFFYARDFMSEWRVWWVSEALGLVLVAPLILAWSTARPRDWAFVSRMRALEAAVVTLATVVTAQFAFGAAPGPSGAVVPLTHLVTPFLVWSALRFHIRGAASMIAMVAMIALWNTATGNGPFAAALPAGAESVLHLQEYLAVIAATALLVGALVQERAVLDAQLRDAQKLEALGIMAGGIAHDFNNILGAILGFGEMAAERIGDDPRLRQPITAILEAGHRGKALVDQILAVSRRAPDKRVPVAAAGVLREVADLLAGSAPPAVTLRLRIDDERAQVLGSATRLHQLVMNLATNGIHAMRDGGSLELSLRSETLEVATRLSHGHLAAGRYVVIGVSDTGSGIAPQVLERIFDPFFTTREAGRGTGLGMVLVQAISKEMSGAIDVVTHVGAGTTVEIYVPASAPPAASAGPMPAAIGDRASDNRTARDGACGTGAARTVLVVDDDRMMLALAEEILAALGYEPVGYDSPLQALAAFESAPQRFDAVLLDQRMPGLSGTELARRIIARRPDLAVIVVSGYGGEDLEERARAAGVACVIAKPYTASGLEQALRGALQLNRRA